MKVLLICSEPVDYAVAFANGLAAHAEVRAVFARQRFERIAGSFDSRVDLDLIDWPRHRSLGNVGLIARLTRRIRDYKPDVIHVLSNTTIWLNAAVPLWRGTPVVTTVHDVTVHPGDRDTARLPGWSARLMARLSDHLVLHGDGLRDAATAAFGKPASRVHVVSHPVITRYAELAKAENMRRKGPDDAFVVLLFGRQYAYKGLKTLLQAEACLGDRIPGLRIVIAGPGDDPNAQRAEMGDPNRYDIRHGFVEDPDVAQLFTDADVIALPYDEASQSGVINVAAPFGKPVVVTDVGELRATVEPARIGLVVPPRAPEALADALDTLARDPDLRRTLGRNARAWANGPNCPHSVGAEVAAIYRRVLEQARGQSSRAVDDPEEPRRTAGAKPWVLNEKISERKA